MLSVELLNEVLEELGQLGAGRSRAASSTSCQMGFTAADLELLGHSSSKSKTILTCLHRLNRATLQPGAAKAAEYKLVMA
eukprot:gene3931-4185_t